MSRFVLDASVTMAWCFEDQGTHFSESVLAALKKEAIPVAPSIWMYEVLNVLALAQKKDLLDKTTATTFWNEVSKAVVLENIDARAPHKILDLCERHKLTAYDAAYLELALREGMPLATLDKDLKKAAQAAGARLFTPATS